tara:strand:+ start:18333 stop:19253 length:921 start_codon:yes stop_codon:yes gene_type:complete
MSKDLLKEAIADAKAVRETAIANAKLALEEAFTPKLQSMLSTKISEDMYEDEEEEVDDMDMDMGDDVAEMGHEEDEVEAEAHHEGSYDEGHYAEDMEGEEMPGEEDEDLELEAIIRELEGEDEEVPAEDEDEMAMEAATSDSVSTKESNDELTNESTEELSEDGDINLDEIIKSLEEAEHEDEEEDEDDSEELKEAYATIKSLQSTLQEVNLLNAKLLFSNKLFKSNDLSEAQKIKVIETFDRAANLREVKLVYSTLTESFGNKKAKAKIAEGLASKTVKSTKPSKEVIVESNDLADRMKRLAGLI